MDLGILFIQYAQPIPSYCKSDEMKGQWEECEGAANTEKAAHLSGWTAPACVQLMRAFSDTGLKQIT